MADAGSGAPDGAGGSSRMWLIVIGCVIVVALAAAMLMHSGSTANRPTLPGNGTQNQQR